VWGEFDVDCRTNGVVGTRDALLRQLSRAYVRAAPGQLTSTSYDPDGGVFAAVGRAAPPQTRVEVWYPAQLHAPRSIAFDGLRHLRVRYGPSGGAVVSATTTGNAWDLLVTPPASRPPGAASVSSG
jgi:hypothetical protein